MLFRGFWRGLEPDPLQISANWGFNGTIIYKSVIYFLGLEPCTVCPFPSSLVD